MFQPHGPLRGDSDPPFTGMVGISAARGGSTAPADSLNVRAAGVAEALRGTLIPVLQQCVGAGLRPASLARALGIDRTLAARVLRAVRATDNVQLLREIPAPGGLRILLEAAARAGALPAEVEAAATGARRFEQLIDEFSGGRAALDAALGGFDEEVQQRNARAASQAIHRSMVSLLGYQAEVMLATVVLQPSAREGLIDTLLVMGKYGVRRLRASSPITVFGWRGDAPDEERTGGRTVETIDGRLAPENGNAYLLTDYCTRPTPPLSLFRSDDLQLYTLTETVPTLNTPVDLVCSQVVRNSAPRYRNDAASFHWETHTPRFPCKVLVSDVFVRDDVFEGRGPTITTRLHSIATGAARPDAPAFQLDNVNLAPPLQHLGTGLRGVAIRDIPDYRTMLEGVFDKVGWNAERFRGYRCRIQYPVPLVSVTLWFDLPPAPELAG